MLGGAATDGPAAVGKLPLDVIVGPGGSLFLVGHEIQIDAAAGLQHDLTTALAQVGLTGTTELMGEAAGPLLWPAG